MDVDYSCYEGREVTGGADVVLSRGRIVVDGDEWLGERGGGRFLKRQRSALPEIAITRLQANNPPPGPRNAADVLAALPSPCAAPPTH